MYVRDVNAKQKNTKLEGNSNYDNDVYSFQRRSISPVAGVSEISMKF
jgi:hypothetical protein